MAFKTGQDTKFQRGTATGDSLPAPGSDTFTDIPNLLEVSFPEFTRETQSYPTLDTADDVVIAGGITKGIVTLKYLRNFGNAIHDSLYSDARSGSPVRRNWKGIRPDAGNEAIDFYGSVTKYTEETVTKRDAYQVTVEITPEGPITVTP